MSTLLARSSASPFDEAHALLPEMSDEDFRALRTLVHQVTGIALADSKRVMLAARLATRLRTLSLGDFRAYRNKLATPRGLEDERQAIINAVTTNKTGFFREKHHFDFIATTIVPTLVARASTTGKREIVIWSAACSTGQEPWTIMMALAETLPAFERWSVRVLATDIDTHVLERAANALYTGSELDGVSPERLARHFEPALERRGAYRLKAPLRRAVTFRQVNFIDERWPIRSRFDFIMCRNASIYFDAPTQAKLFNRLTDLLQPGGWLFVGHAEVLHWMSERLNARPGGIYSLREGTAQTRPPAPTPPASPAPAPAPPPRRPRPSAPSASVGLTAVTINVGETHTSAVPVEIKTLLGSCVAACLFDPIARIGGMNHFLLPHTASTHDIDRQRFGVHAMETLINALMREGADRRRLHAKIFGGGNVLGTSVRRPTVGEQNSAFAREFLQKEGITLVAAHVGGTSGMEVRFHPYTGRAFVRAISRDLIDITREETDQMPIASGDAELFT